MKDKWIIPVTRNGPFLFYRQADFQGATLNGL